MNKQEKYDAGIKAIRNRYRNLQEEFIEFFNGIEKKALKQNLTGKEMERVYLTFFLKYLDLVELHEKLTVEDDTELLKNLSEGKPIVVKYAGGLFYEHFGSGLIKNPERIDLIDNDDGICPHCHRIFLRERLKPPKEIFNFNRKVPVQAFYTKQKYCSEKCQKSAWHYKKHDLKKEVNSRLCPVCNGVITGRNDKRTCGKGSCRINEYRLRKNKDC